MPARRPGLLLVIGAVVCLPAGQAIAQTGANKASYSLTDPTPRALLRDLSTDRPDKTESPYTVDAGRIQVELDLATYTIDRERGVRTETVAIAPVNFKAGLTPSTDLQVIVQPYVRRTERNRATGRRTSLDGFGDVTVRLKRNLWGNDGGPTAFALMPFVKLPTNSGGIDNDAIEFGLIAPLAISVSDGIGLGLMTEIDFVEEADGGGLAPSFVNSATISFDLTERAGLYTEIFTERGSERGADWIVTGDVGLTYAVTDDLQLDGGVNVGLTRAADDLSLFIGLSRRF